MGGARLAIDRDGLPMGAGAHFVAGERIALCGVRHSIDGSGCVLDVAEQVVGRVGRVVDGDDEGRGVAAHSRGIAVLFPSVDVASASFEVTDVGVETTDIRPESTGSRESVDRRGEGGNRHDVGRHRRDVSLRASVSGGYRSAARRSLWNESGARQPCAIRTGSMRRRPRRCHSPGQCCDSRPARSAPPRCQTPETR
jgi:hypothetical protein